ncbi:P12 family lipoprotein [Borreliella garinii]|uniref:P12 family lipoprotein n=1 Tax=Borreliella garinii TaxID=29519 RepID=UPI00292EADEC|nr:P12 family lipoprotein [Borreliella garinii]WNZ73089.1 P12 family lipoprotein [Borreliella garinii]
MQRNLFLYTLLMIGLTSCSLDSKLFGNKEQKNKNDIKNDLDSIQKNTLNKLYDNQEEKKGLKNFEELKDGGLISPTPAESLASIRPTIEKENIGPMVSLETSNNKASIPTTTISIEHNQKKEIKKEIKKEQLLPSTKEEKRADKEIKNIENAIRGSGFPKLIEDMRSLKHEYTSIKSDFYDVIDKINNKITLLMKNRHKNRTKITELRQLQNNLNTANEFDAIMTQIDIAEQDIGDAALFFNEAKESLREGIIKRLENENRVALRLSKQALNKAEDAFSKLENYSSKKNLAMGQSRIIKKLIEQAKTALSKS